MEYVLTIFKRDRRLTRVSKYGSRNKIGYRYLGAYNFDRKDNESMDREVRELRGLYPSKLGFEIEYAPKYKTVKSLMTGQDVQIAADTPHCCDPSSETYWSM